VNGFSRVAALAIGMALPASGEDAPVQPSGTGAVFAPLRGTRLEERARPRTMKVVGDGSISSDRHARVYLLAAPTTDGHILLNTGIRRRGSDRSVDAGKSASNRKTLKFLLISPRTWITSGELRIPSRITGGADRLQLRREVDLLQPALRPDFNLRIAGPAFQFEPVKVDQALHDGEKLVSWVMYVMALGGWTHARLDDVGLTKSEAMEIAATQSCFPTAPGGIRVIGSGRSRPIPELPTL